MFANRSSIGFALFIVGLSLSSACGQSDSAPPAALATYRFDAQEREAMGKDLSGRPGSLNLKADGKLNLDVEAGALRLQGGSMRSSQSAKRLIAAIKRSGAFSVEAWIKPAALDQTGPARILTISKNTIERNFTLGQEGDRIEVRLRTTKADNNGLPSIKTPAASLTTQWTYVVYTRSASGTAKIFIDGKQQLSTRSEGSLQNWDDSFALSIGDEVGGGRAWHGRLRMVSVHGRALKASEIVSHFKRGPEFSKPVAQQSVASSLFEQSIAPLLADRCLECHDSATAQGGLDLSRGPLAMSGGDSGPALVRGDASGSLMWEMINSDEMPADRPALSAAEKALFAAWIDQGADWPLELVDPVLYVHGGGDTQRWLQRLTLNEYITTVQASVGVDISEEARRLLPKDMRADGFSNTAYNLNVDLGHVEAYAELAEIIVSKMDVAAFARRFAKKQRFTDNDMGDLIERMGLHLLRGPVDKRETILFRGISTTVASSGGSYEEAVGLLVEAMLQSPRFIYRVEDQRGDGDTWPVSQYELASRMSYILWGGPPDQKLLDAARDGELESDAAITKQVQRMLDDPRADQRGQQFFYEWLNLGGLSNLQPLRERFPTWKPELAEAMRAESLAYFQYVALDQQQPLARLLNYPVTFASPELAAHYNLAVAGEVPAAATQDSKLLQYDLSQTPRGGILTQGSVLTIGGDDASMVTRGLFVLHDLLRGVVKDPPPCVNTTPVPTRPGLTQRSIALGRIESEACGGCHSRFEPLAFGLEQFDGVGSYHTADEHGNALREDGDVLIPGQAAAIEYQTVRELMDVLAAQPRVQESLTWKVIQFALARPLTAADASAAHQIHQAAQADGGSYRSVMQAIVLSDLVRMQKTEADSVDEKPAGDQQ